MIAQKLVVVRTDPKYEIIAKIRTDSEYLRALDPGYATRFDGKFFSVDHKITMSFFYQYKVTVVFHHRKHLAGYGVLL